MRWVGQIIPILWMRTQRPREPKDLREQRARLAGMGMGAVRHWPSDSWAGGPVLCSSCPSRTKQKSQIKPISSRKEEKQRLPNIYPGPVTFTCSHLWPHTTSLFFWWEGPWQSSQGQFSPRVRMFLCRCNGFGVTTSATWALIFCKKWLLILLFRPFQSWWNNKTHLFIQQMPSTFHSSAGMQKCLARILHLGQDINWHFQLPRIWSGQAQLLPEGP